MIEIKNLVKIYKPKKGAPVYALNGVNIKLEEKGMVFLLGKSGSGKSTLLNVVGGLDRYDDGEIIIKGKSSLNFSQQDFDSYRNTFIGFIFQEYNILEEFTVAQNIGLALELQHKKATPEIVNNILNQVDLNGYGKRKPNELSGGQKQRVAIARALIKEPEIIMADEPTGALDSKTGRQVFETLKKLSKNKLVIVVSHDRESAEIYGDRIVELADGKVINDTQKTYAPAERESDGMTVTDGSIIHIKKGYKLTAKDTKKINDILETAESDAMISVDTKTNEEFRRVAKIDDNGNKETFKKTTELNIRQYDAKSFKLIKSRLPYKDSFKIGASGLKSKKFRLVLTIFLSIISFTLFGLSDTMASYNKYTATLQSLKDSNINYTAVSKSELIKTQDYEYTTNVNMTDTDVEYLKEKFPDYKFMPIYQAGSGYYGDLYISNIQQGVKYSNYYRYDISGVSELTESDYTDLGFTKLWGEYPNPNKSEISVSKALYDSIAYYGLTVNGKNTTIAEYKDLVGKDLELGSKKYKVTAIVDTNFDESRYEALKDENLSYDISTMMLMNEYENVYRYSLHGCIMAAPGFYNNIFMDGSASYGLTRTFYFAFQTQYGFEFRASVSSVMKYDKTAQDIYYGKDNAAPDSLADDEFIMALAMLCDMHSYSYDMFSTMFPTPSYIDFVEFLVDNLDTYNERYADTWGYELIDAEQIAIMQSEYPEIYNEIVREFGVSEIQKGLDAVLENDTYAKQLFYVGETGFKGADDKGTAEFTLKGLIIDDYSIYRMLQNAGIYYEMDYSKELYGVVTFNDKIADFLVGSNGNIKYAITKLSGDDVKDMELIRFSYSYTDLAGATVLFPLKNAVSGGLEMLNEMIEILAKVFLYIGIGFMVFSALLLFNFISVSITYKKREIGVLRAVGARSADVFGIFFNESLIIVIINMIFALITTGVVCNILNGVFRSQAGLLITPLTFGVRQVLLMLLACVGTAAVSTFLPVMGFARKKPIDAINNR